MKIVLAPDSFKGSASSKQLCQAMAEAVHRELPEAEIVQIPIADGGEGTVESIVLAAGGELVTEIVSGPDNRPVEASYGVLADGKTVVIETAQASGLHLVPEEKRNPLHATSKGTGELIAKALDRGYREFIIGLGGSATNDGGMGLLRGLGVEFYGHDDVPLSEGGAALIGLKRIDDSAIHPGIKEAVFRVACDVDNVMCGPQGASAVFGPQKGATPEMVRLLDSALNHFAEVVLRQKGLNMLAWKGGGAAGGIGAAIMAFLQAQFESGIETMMRVVKWEEQIQDADLIITGEGKLDSQTLSGKVIQGLSGPARKLGVPVVALTGKVELTSNELNQLGVTSAFSIVPGPVDLAEAMAHAPEWAARQTGQVVRLIRAFSR
ncbi:glycerate kinase [Xylanibacillus composti]|uniref:Glycerate kinase n=1 Tax=Xylanibacillus composti TaxID=1572762 RepID=A0A8J4H0V7_9BACL|nr:glycerate kinase [Xylanibacillus composti]MDT9727107.1 glycerate kinase [Xylanibacillus composti]GIQ68882.1 glycerate kinase [Xylanibacillus composti]